MKYSVPFFLTLSLACSTTTQNPEVAENKAVFSPSETESIERLLAAHPVPRGGVALAIARLSDGATTKLARGTARDEVPLKSSTVLEIGSVTKQFTGAMILQLVESGELSLDEPLRTIFTDYPEVGAAIEVRHLLNHTSGIPNYTSTPGFSADPSRVYSKEEMLALFADAPLQFAPGEGFAYSNSGYYLLGLILEAKTGKPYDVLLEERITGPLGLTSTGYCDEDPSTLDRAQGFNAAGPVPSVHMSQPFAAGAICSTAEDLLQWSIALHTGGVVTLDTDIDALARLPDGSPVFYRAGLFVGRTKWRTTVGHGGNIDGFTARAEHFVDEGLLVVSLQNLSGARLATLHSDIVDAIAGALPAGAADDADARASAVGVYRATGLPTIEIFSREAGLTAKFGSSPELSLEHIRDLDYEYPDAGIRLRFVPDADRLEFEQQGVFLWMARANE